MDFHDDMQASFSNVQTYDDEDLPATQLLCPFEEKDSDINNTILLLDLLMLCL